MSSFDETAQMPIDEGVASALSEVTSTIDEDVYWATAHGWTATTGIQCVCPSEEFIGPL